MQHVYHYHAQVHAAAGVLMHIDGIILTERHIDSMERYRAAKVAILSDMTGPVYSPESLVITNLSYLGSKP